MTVFGASEVERSQTTCVYTPAGRPLGNPVETVSTTDGARHGPSNAGALPGFSGPDPDTPHRWSCRSARIRGTRVRPGSSPPAC